MEENKYQYLEELSENELNEINAKIKTIKEKRKNEELTTNIVGRCYFDEGVNTYGIINGIIDNKIHVREFVYDTLKIHNGWYTTFPKLNTLKFITEDELINEIDKRLNKYSHYISSSFFEEISRIKDKNIKKE